MSSSPTVRAPRTRKPRAIAIFAVALFLTTTLLPVVEATHLTLYQYRNPADGSPLAPGIGVTYEDDGMVARQPGGLLDGIENQVLLNTTEEVGDGSLFLDAVYYNHEQAYFDGATVMAPAFGGKRVMFLSGGFMAWYGWFKDLDGDGRINDHHDAAGSYCHVSAPANCGAVDEFKWKGAASGDSLEMALFFLPSELGGSTATRDSERLSDTSIRPTRQFGAWQNGTSHRVDARFADRTSQTGEEQLWVGGNGWPWLFTDESFLLTTQTIVIANAEKSNADLPYNFDDPDASIDVDQYESLSPEIESLWVSSARNLQDTIFQTRRAPTQIGPMINGYAAIVSAAINNVSRLINEVTTGQTPVTEAVDQIVDPIVDPVLRDADEADRAATDATNPQFAKEPNTAQDVYPGATFGGVASWRGIGNDYSGYQSEHQLFMDSRLFARVPYGANVITPFISYGVYGQNTRAYEEPMPCDGCGENQRGATPGFLGAITWVGLWNDANGDQWPGERCDPADADEWDAENNVCADIGNRGDAAGFGSTEMIPICGTTTLNGGGGQASPQNGIKITPMPGNEWPAGVTTLKWYDRPTRNIFRMDETHQPTGSESVVLEYDACTGGATNVRSVDVLFIPTGSLDISILVETTATMTKAFNDAETGITLPIQSVRDVDVYYATL